MKYYLYLFFIISILSRASAQSVGGVVTDNKNQPLIGATVLELGTQNGAITDEKGSFELTLEGATSNVVVSYSGFLPDTISGPYPRKLSIVLAENTKALDEIVVRGQRTFFDRLEPKHVEVITEAELTKAACCNLSESFETNASVDVSFTDAITGAKTLKMLGLDGRYVQINRENIPNVRGLSGRYGLSYMPGTWIQSIDLGKGSGSVVNGYESMTGQINVELKKPESSEKIYLNAYANAFGRMELNANLSQKIGKKWHGGILLHTNYFNNELDKNKDGFMDLPKGRQINMMNRYKYLGEKVASQIGFNLMRDERAGGQLGFGFNDDFRTSPQYGFQNNTTRVEVFGKTGLLFPNKPYKGWGFIYAASHLRIAGGFGRDNYKGKETTIYGNMIFQNIIGNSFHKYKTGASILYDDFQEVYADSIWNRQEIVPGLYYEYTYSLRDRLTVLAGVRTDFHNLYGTYFTPRLHARFQVDPNTTLRGAIGRGYRTANVIMENSNALVSSRQLIVTEALKPEVSWNMGGSLSTRVMVSEKALNLIIDYFYTNFENQLIYDMDRSADQLRVYNLDGISYAQSLQFEANYQFSDRISVKGAYKFYDVKATINQQLRPVPFNASNRLFFNVAYRTKYDKWKADYTFQWFGKKRLPNTSDNAPKFQRGSFSPDFLLMNLQISRSYRWGSVYLGAENLLDFKQKNPIIDAENPFGAESEFDAAIVWGPIIGRMIYAGFTYKI